MTPTEQFSVWQRQLTECATISDFNRFIVPQMKTDEQFKVMAAAEAKRRGYKPDKTLGVYLPAVDMKLTKGRVIIRVGWAEGVLYAEYASSDKLYSYPGMTEEQCQKLLRSAYPDHLWTGYKKAWEAQKVQKEEA